MNNELTRRTILHGVTGSGLLPLAGSRAGAFESQQDELATNTSGSSLPPLAWEWTEDTSEGDLVVQDLVETQDGAIVCTGIEGNASGVQNVLLRKIDNTGETIWSRTLSGDRNDAALGIQQADDGSFVLCGGSMSEGSNLMDTTVWLAGSDGTLERSVSFGTSGTNDAAHSIATGSDGYVLGGGTHYLGGAFGEGVGRLVKIDDDGAEEWSTTVEDGHAGEIYDITTTNDGQYAFVGTRAGDENEGRAWLGVVDGSGDLEWSRTYGSSGSRIGYSLVETDDGGFAFAGTTQPPGQDEPRAWVVKVDLRGDLEWERTYGGTGHDALVSIDQAMDEGYILGGWTEDEDDGDMGWLLHVDNGGRLESEEIYGDDADDRFNVVTQTEYGYTGGGLTIGPTGSPAAWVLGLSEDADQPLIDPTSIDIDPYPVEQGERPIISVNIDDAEEARVLAQYTTEAGNANESSHSMTEQGDGRWISSQLPPIEKIGWVDVTIEAENEVGATSTVDTFAIDDPTVDENGWLIEDPTLGYHVFEYVANVAVVLGRFADENPPSGTERDTLEAWKRARERDTNVYYGSGRGLRGAIGFKMTFYDNEGDLYQVEDSHDNYSCILTIPQRAELERDWIPIDPGCATGNGFMEDLRDEFQRIEGEHPRDGVQFWIGTHRGTSVEQSKAGVHLKPLPGVDRGGLVYSPMRRDRIQPRPETTNYEEEFAVWLHEIGHACGLDHPSDHGNIEEKCVMTGGLFDLQDRIETGTETNGLNPVSPMSTVQGLSETLGINTGGTLNRRQDWFGTEMSIDFQNLSESWSRVAVPGLQQLELGDNVPMIEYHEDVTGPSRSDHHRFVFEARPFIRDANEREWSANNWNIDWGTQNGAAVIYRWEGNDRISSTNRDYNLLTNSDQKPYLIDEGDQIKEKVTFDDERFVTFELEEKQNSGDPESFVTNLRFRLDPGEPQKIVYSINDGSGIPDWVEINSCADYMPPSLDLKAVDSEGRTVGVNEDGEYINEIPGASASGKRIQGTEWISVPEGTDVELRVSSGDVAQFIEDIRELGSTGTENGAPEEITIEELESELTAEYSFSETVYGANPELVEEDGENIVVDARTRITEDRIEPGVETEVDREDLEVVHDRLLDGPIDQLPGVEYIASGGAVTAGLFYLAYRMLSNNQENSE